MLLRVYVDSPERFTAWLDQQAQPASDPPMDNPRAVEGKHVFLSESCINCHAVRGTLAKGTYAPDLTHLMSRETLASGMIPNTPENLRKWVADPQQIKRGCLMPAFGLSEENLDLVVAYLLTLK
jgi:cytochrome c oxidase subunit 2